MRGAVDVIRRRQGTVAGGSPLAAAVVELADRLDELAGDEPQRRRAWACPLCGEVAVARNPERTLAYCFGCGAVTRTRKPDDDAHELGEVEL